MNKKRSTGDKPLLHHAFLSVTHDDQDRFFVVETSIKGLGDIHEPVGEVFQKAVADRIFTNPDYAHINMIFFRPLAANDVLPAEAVTRQPAPAA